jgi:hypothetical protein
MRRYPLRGTRPGLAGLALAADVRAGATGERIGHQVDADTSAGRQPRRAGWAARDTHLTLAELALRARNAAAAAVACAVRDVHARPEAILQARRTGIRVNRVVDTGPAGARLVGSTRHATGTAVCVVVEIRADAAAIGHAQIAAAISSATAADAANALSISARLLATAAVGRVGHRVATTIDRATVRDPHRATRPLANARPALDRHQPALANRAAGPAMIHIARQVHARPAAIGQA